MLLFCAMVVETFLKVGSLIITKLAMSYSEVTL